MFRISYLNLLPSAQSTDGMRAVLLPSSLVKCAPWCSFVILANRPSVPCLLLCMSSRYPGSSQPNSRPTPANGDGLLDFWRFKLPIFVLLLLSFLEQAPVATEPSISCTPWNTSPPIRPISTHRGHAAFQAGGSVVTISR